jgi:hypothetical protein
VGLLTEQSSPAGLAIRTFRRVVTTTDMYQMGTAHDL